MNTQVPKKTLVDHLVNKYLIRSIDKPFLVCLLKCSIIFVTAIAIFAFPTYALFIFPVHIIIYGYFLGPFITMYHDINHHPLLKNKTADKYLISLFGTIYGMTPNTYFCHHIIMHHPEDNGYKDLSTTRPYQRDSFKDFLKYYSEFIFCLFSLSAYLKVGNNKQKKRHANAMIISELSYIVVTIILLIINPIGALAVAVIPTLMTRSCLIVGNWGEHAFIDATDPTNPYTNTTNILGKFNKIWFNVGFHIGHHINPTKHYSLLEQDFYDNIETYAQEDAIVFKDVHFPHIWFYLMTKNYKKLAKLYVRLPGHEQHTDDEIIQLLKERVHAIPKQQNNLIITS
ncbi:MAG: hypothetical protein GY810_07740 [Aureispira sp.]|nr:hypothetical protein [Aureispira sp.]